FRKPYGAILVTGPTGSGKSTTMYSTLNILNQEDKNIITVEDPVEYRLAGVNQMQVNPKAGLTFASALRSILRADPDIVLIGEVRDRETAMIAVEAALTGHLVLSSLRGGCQACSSTGFRGRIGMYEVMVMSEEIERLTVERGSADVMRAVAIEQGMQTLREDGLAKTRMGLTSIEEVARVVK